jgi:hypothetical protein
MASKKSEGALTSSGGLPFEQRIDVEGATPQAGTVFGQINFKPGSAPPYFVELPAADQLAALPLKLSNAVTSTLGVTEPIAPAPPAKRTARTEVGIAVLGNGAPIILSTAGLWLQIEEKLASLREERWNSPEKQTLRDQAIEIYEDLKKKTEALLYAVSKFSTEESDENTLTQATTPFTIAFNNWWNERHKEVFDMALFLSGAGILTLLGAGGVITASICGVLIGGKQVAETIKSLGKDDQ